MSHVRMPGPEIRGFRVWGVGLGFGVETRAFRVEGLGF